MKKLIDFSAPRAPWWYPLFFVFLAGVGISVVIVCNAAVDALSSGSPVPVLNQVGVVWAVIGAIGGGILAVAGFVLALMSVASWMDD